MKIERIILLTVIIFCEFVQVSAYANNTGTISGTLKLDDSWEPIIYLSEINSFEEMNSMSSEMIISKDTLDSFGHFKLDIGFLPEKDHLVRVHIVKKKTSPTSLIVGGIEENHTFLIANKYSKITLYALNEKPIFKDMLVSNSPKTKLLQYITELISFPNLIKYEETPLEKTFVEQVVSKKLKHIADTCQSALLSLYAIYGIDFKRDYLEDQEYYESFLDKWGNNKSSYFETFRRQVPANNKPWNNLFLIIISLVFIGLIVRKLIIKKKLIKLNELSVQERRVYELLKLGASNQEISDKFHIELSTVKSHVSRIFSKLNIKSRKEVLNIKK